MPLYSSNEEKKIIRGNPAYQKIRETLSKINVY